MIKLKQFNGFALPLIIFTALILTIGGCSSDDTAASLSATEGDGIAELTGVPVFADSTLSTSASTLNVSIPVDSDTAFLDVYLHPVGDSDTTVASANNQSVTASATNVIALTVISAPTAGTAYYIELVVCDSGTTTCLFTSDLGNFDANDTGYIDADPTTGVYQKLSFSPSSSTSTGVGIPTVTAE